MTTRADIYNAADCCWSCFNATLDDYLAEQDTAADQEDTEGPTYD